MIRCKRIGHTICLLIISVLTDFSNDCSAQKKTSADSAGNLIPYFDRILIKANISTQTDDYFLTEETGPGLTMRANNEYKMFLSLDYQFIGFSYGFSPRLFGGNNDDYLKGKSSFTDYKFFVFIGQWLQTLEYSKTRGYYVENTGDFFN